MKHLFCVCSDVVAAPVLCFVGRFLKVSDVAGLFMPLVNISALLALSAVMS